MICGALGKKKEEGGRHFQQVRVKSKKQIADNAETVADKFKVSSEFFELFDASLKFWGNGLVGYMLSYRCKRKDVAFWIYLKKTSRSNAP